MIATTRNLALIVGLLGSGLLAQTKPASIIPKDPIITFHIDGPAALRAAFLPTNLGQMFAGPEFKDMTAPIIKMIEALKSGGGGPQLPFDADVLETAILNYSGRVSAALHLFDDQIDFNGDPPAFAVTVTLTPDGKTNLAGFCKQTQELAEEMMGEALQDMEVAGTTLSYIHDEDGQEPGFILPFMHQGHAVFLIASDLKKAAARVLDEDAERHTTESRFATANLGVSFHVQRMLTLIAGGLKASLGPMWDSVGRHVYKGSGLQSLVTIDVTYRAKGPAVVSEAVVNFNQNDRGILGSLFGEQTVKSPLIDLLPRNAMAASAGPFDLKRVYQGVKSIFAEMGDDAPMPFEDVEEQFKEYFGLRLYEDLIGLFGADILTVQLETDDFQPGNPLAAVDGNCFGFSISDGTRIAKTIDTMLRKEGLHAGRKKNTYKGFTVYELNIAMMLEVHYAVTDNLLVIGLGEVGGDAVRATLDQVKARADGREAEPLPTPVVNRLKMVKGGYSGLAWSDVELQIEGMGAMLEGMSGMLPPEFDVVSELLEGLPKLFKNYKVKYQVGVSRSEGSRWIYENIW